MNSKSFKEKFKNVMNSFYISSDIVLSLPFSIAISWWTSCVFWWLLINQAIPLRVYIWIKSNNSWKLTLKSYLKFNSQNWELEEVFDSDFFAPSQSVLDLVSSQYGNFSWEISLVSEYEWKDSELIITGIILWLELYSKNIDESYIDWIKTSSFKDLFADDRFESIVNKCMLTRLQYNASTIWGSSLSSLFSWIIDTRYPIFHMAENIFDKISDISVDRLVEATKKDRWKYITKRVDDLIDVSSQPSLNYDIYMLSIWDYKNSNWYRSMVNWIKRSNEFIDMFSKGNHYDANHFFLESKSDKDMHKNTIDIISAYTCNVWKVFLDNIEWKEKIDWLFYYLMRNHEIIWTLLGKYNLSSFEHISHNLELLKNMFIELFPSSSYKDMVVYISWASLDQKYVVLVPSYFPKININLIDEALKRYFWDTSSVIYSSKHDWLSEEWIIIEQNQFSSDFAFEYDSNLFVIEDVDGNISYWEYSSLLSSADKWLLFDCFNWKIFLDWRKLSSKEIHSQNYTVELMDKLRKNIKSNISNSELPKSSYSKSKNEMIWKIVAPLLKLVKEVMWYDLPLVCKWGNWDYYIKLDTSDVPMYFLSKRISKK